ncbi:sialin-like isoform X2 [Epargyreus clarus]|uniref:sialin-like isoform X2 n=1 Tax=Epargyreus clarus TaxID=520877 RepID=UPI003C2B9595
MYKIRIRVMVGIMIFLGYFLVYVVRYNLSVHIVDMVKIKKRIDSENFTYTYNLRAQPDIRARNLIDVIYWDEMKIALLLSAYHIGYCICFPIFHNIGDRLGPTWIVGIAGISSGVFNCLTPASVYFNYWLLFIVRILNGFCAGAMQPSMVQVLRHWVPPIERNHFMWAYCGITMGTCSTFLICAAVHLYSRWAVGFYVCGALQVAWAAAWIGVVTDCPAKHSFISKAELTYLTNTIGTVFTIKLTNSQAPWKLILRSVPFWALCGLNFGYAWMIISLCLHGPLYYTMILHYSIYNASALTALPFFLRLVLGTIVIQTFHSYKQNTTMKRITHIRKYFIIVSHVIPGFLVLSMWTVASLPGPIILTMAISLTAAGMDLTLDICYELTQMYANSINTVIKIIGHTAGIIVSLGVGHVTKKYEDAPRVWKNIWCFHGLVLCLSGIIFLIWGETCTQPWNNIRSRPQRKNIFIKQKASIMSNITETEENES